MLSLELTLQRDPEALKFSETISSMYSSNQVSQKDIWHHEKGLFRI